MSRPTTIKQRTAARTREALELGQIWPPRPILSPLGPLLDEQKISCSLWVRDNLDPDERSPDPDGTDLWIDVSTCGPLQTLDGQPLPVRFKLESTGRPSRKYDGGWEKIDLEGSFEPRDQRSAAADAGWTRAILKVRFRDEDGNIASFFTWFYLGMGRQHLDPADKTLHRWMQADGGTVTVEGLQHAWLNLNPARDFENTKTTPGVWLHHGLATEPGRDDDGDTTPPTVVVVPSEPDPCTGWSSETEDGKAPIAIDPDGRFIAGAHPVGRSALGVDPQRDAAGALLVRPVHTTLLTQDGTDRARAFAPRSVEDHIWPVLRGRGDRLEAVVRDQEEPGRAEPVALELDAVGGDLRVAKVEVRAPNGLKIGEWSGDRPLRAGEPLQLGVDLDVAEFKPKRKTLLALTATIQPDIGAFPTPVEIDVDQAPFVVGDLLPGDIGHPYLILDIGTDASCAALACRVGNRTRVFAVRFDGSLLLPTRVWFAKRAGRWGLIDEEADDALVSPLVKLALVRGDDFHPACPEHVDSSRVVLSFVRRFLRKVKASSNWFPFDTCKVLAAFPPRLACIPQYSRSLQDVLLQALRLELGGDDWKERLSFREEALIVAFPVLSSFEPGTVVYVVDCGGGTTDVCYFRLNDHPLGYEGFVVDSYRYPDVGDAHMAGSDMTEAFYAHFHKAFDGVGKRIPKMSRPLRRHSTNQKWNQAALLRLAEWTKCHPEATEWPDSVRRETFRPESLDGALAEYQFFHELHDVDDYWRDNTPADVHAQVLDEGLGARLDALASKAMAEARELSEAGETVHIVVAGRASQFAPLHERLRTAAPPGARFERLDGSQLRAQLRAAGRGVTDDATVLKTATALGGAVVAINSLLDANHVQMILEPSAPGFDCPLFLEPEQPAARWQITSAVKLADGEVMELEPERMPPHDGNDRVFGNVELTVRGHDVGDDYPVVGSGFIPKKEGRRRSLGPGWKLEAKESPGVDGTRRFFLLHPPDGADPLEFHSEFEPLPVLGWKP